MADRVFGPHVTGHTVVGIQIGARGSAPALFGFQFALRAQGSVRVGPFQIPVSAQVDAFDVLIPADAAVHQQIVDAHTKPSP